MNWNEDPWHGDRKAVQINSQRKNLSGEPGHDRNRARKKKQLTCGKPKFPEGGTRAESKTKRTNAIASSEKD
jgi:hypothetical protein